MKKQNEKPTASEADEEVEVRHTISAEETFTLAKDVFDIRCMLKKLYASRHNIINRLNLISLWFSVLFTALYIAFMVYGGVIGKLSLGWDIAAYSILGLYITMAVLLLFTNKKYQVNGKTKNNARYKRALKILRFAVRALSVAMGVVALIISIKSGKLDTVSAVLQTVATTFSVIMIVLSAIPLIFGGIGGLARWIISPVKIKHRSSFVFNEWFDKLPLQGQINSKYINDVDLSLMDEIQSAIDEVINPNIGKKYIFKVTSTQVLSTIGKAKNKRQAEIMQGVFKNVFGYALECKYINLNPCKDLKLQGSIAVAEKPKKEGIVSRIGKKVGASFGKKLISSILGGDEKDKKNK